MLARVLIRRIMQELVMMTQAMKLLTTEATARNKREMMTRGNSLLVTSPSTLLRMMSKISLETTERSPMSSSLSIRKGSQRGSPLWSSHLTKKQPRHVMPLTDLTSKEDPLESTSLGTHQLEETLESQELVEIRMLQCFVVI
jgi:hypothetical protein